jgi:uncharacterized protein YaiI (UPF0178 family)
MSDESPPSAPAPPRIYVDADGAPRVLIDLLLRFAARREVPTVFVANRWLDLPARDWIRAITVSAGADVADDWIVEHCGPGDLVVSSDVPLAARAVERGAQVLQFYGRLLDASNVREHLSVRDFSTELREAGVVTGGPKPFDARTKQAFANALDRWAARSRPR